MTYLSIASIAALLMLFFSPVAARRCASALESIAAELRRHAGAMEAAYAAYRSYSKEEPCSSR